MGLKKDYENGMYGANITNSNSTYARRFSQEHKDAIDMAHYSSHIADRAELYKGNAMAFTKSRLTIIIPCAGRGVRAREVVGDIPKSLYPLRIFPSLGHILNYIEPIDAEVRVVVDPAYRDLFSSYSKRYEIYEQPQPRGDGDAVFCAMSDLRYSQTPVLIILGDQIPIGPGAEAFRSRLCGDPLDYNLITVQEKYDLEQSTWAKTRADGRIYEFVPVRGDYKVPGKNLEHAGFDYIERADHLYDSLRLMLNYKQLSFGEYRLTSAYQSMIHKKGSTFQSMSIQYLSVGDLEGIEYATRYFAD